ncbi:hypothetical protein [Hyphomonas sp.]|uniref:hypothetical protein n=1 Tax=Hyphomonas sp. TaxID=87 RepID=UPI003002BBA4
MGLVEKQRLKRMRERIDNPHEWAEEIERRVDQRLLFPAFAGLFSIAAIIACIVMWRTIERQDYRIETIEGFLTETFPSEQP